MMTGHPGRVSVIICVYNGERFLAEALDSVFAQDYRPIEVIVVDDGSEDRSAEIARSYEGVTVVSQPNLGLAAARNTGIAAATGELITFLDADDLMLPTKLSEHVGYMRVHPEVACTLAPWQNFGDGVDEVVPEPVPPPSKPLDVTRPEALVHLRAGGISAVIKREALEIVGGFDVSFDFAEDLDWLFRLREAPVEAVILPRVTDRKRFHTANMTRDRSAARNGWLRFVKGVAERRHGKAGPIVTRPLVSVIICVYNGGRFLAEALDSVFAQDYRPIEVIVVDDGSEDRSAEIARSYEGVTVVSQPNLGLAAARNTGIAAATGELIAFLDADDLMLPTKLSQQVGYLEDHPKVGLVLCRQKLVPVSGSKLPSWARPDPIFGDPGGVPPASGVVRRAALRAAGNFDASLRTGDGMEWLGRLREAGVVIDVLPEVLLLRRVHERNLTHDQRSLTETLFRTLRARALRARQARMEDA